MTFATFLGALIPTAIVSRIFLLVTKRWEGGAYRIVMVHALSLITSWMIIYLANDVPDWALGITYVFAQAFWLVAELIQYHRKKVRNPISG